MNLLRRIKLWFKRINPKLSDVYVYFENHDTRFMTTPFMSEADRKKFLKYMFDSYQIKFIGIDNEVHYPKSTTRRRK